MAGTHLEYIQECSVCKTKAEESGGLLICKRKKERWEKGSLADPETRMKLCSLLIRSPAEIGRIVNSLSRAK